MVVLLEAHRQARGAAPAVVDPLEEGQLEEGLEEVAVSTMWTLG